MRHKQIGLDSSIFIYQVEGNPKYVPLTDLVFDWLEHPDSRASTSTITMCELLTQPYRFSDAERVEAFYEMVGTYPNLQWIAPDLGAADTAAKLRANYRLRTADAFQAACAIHAQSSGFITN